MKVLENIFVDNPHIKYSGWVSIDNFENAFLNKGIKRYEKFNRKKVWTKKDIEDLRKSTHKGDLYNPMVVVPIKESIDLAIKTGSKGDEKFFKGAYENGANQWLTLIGGNRGESIQAILISNDDIHNKEFKKLLVPMIVTNALSRKDIHRKFGADLRGVIPNAQESRNSIWNGDNCESEWVRAKSLEYTDMILAKNGLGRNTKRMLDDEFVASLCAFTRYRSLGSAGGYSKLDDVIDAIYKENTTSSERKSTVDMLNYLQRIWKHMPNTKLQVPKVTYWQGLIVTGGLMQDDKLIWFGRTSPKLFIESFNSWWLKMITDEDTMYKPSNTKITFRTMIGGFKRDTHIKEIRLLLHKFINDMVKKNVLKIDRSEDLATPDQRRKLTVERMEGNEVWVRQNGSVEGEMMDDKLEEFILVPLSEVNDKVKYPTDHIIPKDVNFSDALENMEITTQKYNSWKRKRIPDYNKKNIKKTLTRMAI